MVPDLSNWQNDMSDYDTSDADYLKQVEQNSRLHHEVLKEHKPSDLPTINAIAQNSYLRGLNKFAVYKEFNWYWIAGGLASVLFIISLLLFSESVTHTPHTMPHYTISQENGNHSSSIIADASTQKNYHVASSSLENKSSLENNNTHIDAQNNDKAPQKNNDNSDIHTLGKDAPENKTNPENDNQDHNLLSAHPLDKKEDKSDSRDKSDHKTKPEYTGFKTTGSAAPKSNKRNPNQEIKVSSVRVEQMQNLAVYLNSRQNDTKVTHGQLQNSSGSQTSVDYSPEDMPAYPGGNDRLEEDLKYLVAKHSFSEKYEQNVSAMVSFTIDAKGRMDDIKIYSHKTQEIKKAITNALHELDPWSRGKKIGKKGSVHYEILLSFK